MLAEQGAYYTDGLLPPFNVTNSPMQAWHDSIYASSSSSSSVSDNMLLDIPTPI
jgi:hypothetical protein